ncbi:ATP-binding protein [Streptomyces sp. KLMMK]|uniref:ATP-binding protein n=1 Tax=Streptomyces sp. KLMMK TaxID=3109353 RepID=UPI00300ADFCA
MYNILYGSSRITLTSGSGTRLERSESLLRDPRLRHQGSGPAAAAPLLLGREQELADAWREVLAGRPVEFHGPCGLGKTTLLRSIAGSGGRRSAFVRVAGNPLEDVLQLLVDALYLPAGREPVKYPRPVCERLVNHPRPLIVLDEVPPGSRIPRQLSAALPDCVLLVGSERPVLSGSGMSLLLAGLPPDPALDLFTRSLGRPLPDAELPPVRRLLEAVRFRPLHIRQAAALVRAGHPVETLTRAAARDPRELDRLSAGSLSGPEREALVVLALAAGTLVPGNWVSAVGDIAYAVQSLVSLHERGLVERPEEDRFGLPVCLKESLRGLSLGAVSLSAGVNGLADWLDGAVRGDVHGLTDALEGVEGVVGLLGVAFEQGEWRAAVRLAKIAEAALFVVLRWQQWKDVLEKGEEAARRIGDRASEALFAHQLGTVAYVEDRPADAQVLLRHALRLREDLGDAAGAALTSANLEYVTPSGAVPGDGPGPTPRGWVRRAVLWAAGLLAAVVAIVAAREAVHEEPPGPAPGPAPGPSAPGGSAGPATGGQVTRDPATGGPVTRGPASSGLTGAASHTWGGASPGPSLSPGASRSPARTSPSPSPSPSGTAASPSPRPSPPRTSPPRTSPTPSPSLSPSPSPSRTTRSPSPSPSPRPSTDRPWPSHSHDDELW